MCAGVRGFLAGKPQIIRWALRSQFTFRTQAPFSSSVSYSSTRWLLDPVLLIQSSYQQFWNQGAWEAKPPDQFASLPRDLRTSTCVKHSLWHGKTINPANSQLHKIPPSLKTSPLIDFGFVLLGYHRRQKVQGHLQFGSWCMHILSGAFQPAYQW